MGSIDAKFNEFNIQINERFNASEEKQNVSSQQIKELDQGNQGLLEKLLNLEKNLGDGFSTLEATDKNIGENVNSLNNDLAAVKDIFERNILDITKISEENRQVHSSNIKLINENILNLEKFNSQSTEKMVSLETRSNSLSQKVLELDEWSKKKLKDIETYAEGHK